MAYKISQYVNPIAASASVASTSNGIALKSGYLRVATATTGVYVDIGGAPVAATNTLLVPANTSVVIKDRVARVGVVGITTGTSTVLTLDTSVNNPFIVGDYVTIESGYPTGINSTHSLVTATTDISSYWAGTTNPTITISFNSSSVTGVALTGTTAARSTKISALGAGGATNVSITEIQITSSAT
jgi:hypothetical protein